ncbi:MAG TPA: hypothetical protein VFL82_05760, partial [Thermomicrobiales bacterium]|nr:hypothetical protein [Thermomicrobiales bacterium]
MTKLPEKMLTRRAFGRGLAGVTAASVLAVHGGSSRFTAAADDDVYVMMEKTFADIGVREATDIYNDQHKDSPTIKVEEAATGWEAKVLPQIRDKKVRWSGHGYVPFFDQYKEVKAGLVAPLEEYLEASSIPWAHQQKDVYFTPRIHEALVLDGKQYFIPMKSN